MGKRWLGADAPAATILVRLMVGGVFLSETEKIATAIERALVRRPKRARSAEPFLSEKLPAVLEVVERRDPEAFLSVMERFRTACMKCHVSEDVPYFTIEFPEVRLSTIRATASRAR